MKVQKTDNNFFDNTKDIHIINGKKELFIMYGGNLDLYWGIIDHGIEDTDKTPSIEFRITKENYALYEEFLKLINRIRDIDIFDRENLIETDDEPLLFDSDFEEDKKYYKEYNGAHYNDLFDGEKVTWYSDETAMVAANYVTIKEDGEDIVLHFDVQEHVDGYDEDSHHYNRIAIRFRNSGSRYNPFNVVFMRMYQSLQEIDDVLDEGHQIHLEEYLYNKQRIRKK